MRSGADFRPRLRGRFTDLAAPTLNGVDKGPYSARSMRNPFAVFVWMVGVSSVAGACGGGGTGGGDAKAPVKCGGEERVPLSCETEFKYEGRRIEGGFSALGVGNANAKTDEVALRQIDQQTEQYAAQSKRLCEEYNACIVDKETYGTRSENLRRRMAKAPELYDGLKAATDPEARRKALADAYQQLVPDESRTELSLSLGVQAKKPTENGFSAIAPGTSLPTETRVAFALQVSRAAHVYLFQKSPDGKLAVLFPDARIAAQNPIPAGTELRIPPSSGAFRLNDKDIGTERVYVVASLQPLPSLAQAAAQVANGGAPSGALAKVAEVPSNQAQPNCSERGLELDDASSSGCVRPRGLELDPEPASGASLRARTEAADGVLFQVFSFEHTK